MALVFGNRSLFALVLEPLAAAPLEADEAAACTWVSTSIYIRGHNLSAHTHVEEQRVEEGIHWPAIYLARWLVHHWDALFLADRWPVPGAFNDAHALTSFLDQHLIDDELEPHKVEAIANTRDTFVRSHAWNAAAAGGLAPNLWLHRDNNAVVFVWKPQPAEHVSFHQSEGYARVPASTFADAVTDFVAWVTLQLGQGRAPTCLAEAASFRAWIAAQQDAAAQAEHWLRHYIGLSEEGLQELARLSADNTLSQQLGLPAGWSNSGAGADPSVSPLACVFRCAAPTIGPPDIRVIFTAVQRALQSATDSTALDTIAGRISTTDPKVRSYQQGYALARDVRRVLQLDNEPIDVEELCGQWGIQILEISLMDASVDGGAVWAHSNQPCIFVNLNSGRASSKNGRRMVIAHELCHLLVDRHAAVPLALLSGPWAPARLERRANAFAAELLLPIGAIRQVLGPNRTELGDDSLELLCQKWQVSKVMALNHVLNRMANTSR